MKYYVANGKEPKGPYTIEELRTLGVAPETLMWHEGMAQWQRADAIDEIRREVLGMNPTPEIPSTPAGGQPYGAYGQPGPAYAPGSQPYQPNGGYVPCPNSWIWLSLLTLICCCTPLGIVSLVYSCKVSSNYNIGNYAKALDCSNKARNWAIAGIILGIVSSIVFSILEFTTGMFGGSDVQELLNQMNV